MKNLHHENLHFWQLTPNEEKAILVNFESYAANYGLGKTTNRQISKQQYHAFILPHTHAGQAGRRIYR